MAVQHIIFYGNPHDTSKPCQYAYIDDGELVIVNVDLFGKETVIRLDKDHKDELITFLNSQPT